MASFCNVLESHTAKLQIPPQFVKNHGEIFRQSSKMVTLKIDDESGKMWRVGTEQTGDFQFLSEGWTKFAKDVDLQCPSFVIFKLLDNKSTFHVSIYDQTACIKNYSYSENDDDDDDDDDELENGEIGKTRWRFSKELKEHHFLTSRMIIPKAFAVGTGIATKQEITLQDGKGREWPVGVTRAARNNNGYGITRGWKRFLAENEAGVGSIISFEFIGGSANLVRALVKNNGTPES